MVSLIIAAAGSGSRMQHKEKKQFIELNQEPILSITIKQFLIDGIDEIVIVTGKDDIERVESLIHKMEIDKTISVVAGGNRRQDSVYNALQHCQGNIVMIHDGARPFIERSVILEHLNRINKEKALITAVKTKDTIKVVVDYKVQKTLDRNLLMNVQTPQTFFKDQLIKAYDQSQLPVTDDASVMEEMGFEVGVVEGHYSNIKITTPEDLDFAELILRGLK